MRLSTFFILVWIVSATWALRADEPITVKTDLSRIDAAWPVPKMTEVRKELDDWLHAGNFGDASKREEILAAWPLEEPVPPLSGRQLFEQIIQSMSRATPVVSEYLSLCDRFTWQELPFGQPIVLPQIPLQVYLSRSTSSKYLLGTLRFHLAQRLVQARLYDEAGTILDEMTPENSVDPAAVLITKAIVDSQISENPEKGLAAIKEFRKAVRNDPSVPRRYVELAKLLEADLKKDRKKDDPKNISQKMDDVRRRLGKGRTDDETQDAEKGVLKSLDRLIEKIEQQAQKQNEAENGSDQGQQANKPADDSRILKQKGPGNVDRREFDPNGNWGDLPPKEREEALLRIEKEFPAHYRDIIEQYFREMAGKADTNSGL